MWEDTGRDDPEAARVQELVGSLGSDAGEHIRRAMDSPPVNLGWEIMGLEIHVSAARSVGVESAYSVGVELVCLPPSVAC